MGFGERDNWIKVYSIGHFAGLSMSMIFLLFLSANEAVSKSLIYRLSELVLSIRHAIANNSRLYYCSHLIK
ncbi:hypothetical protein lpa_00463 [Legionella pneumophila 2300/99 Alcoy]|nr:hypothetical protein lpa_00463 [Legionella pneumophila 2300/99 Alcoy]